jgi:hypothetical protein
MSLRVCRSASRPLRGSPMQSRFRKTLMKAAGYGLARLKQDGRIARDWTWDLADHGPRPWSQHVVSVQELTKWVNLPTGTPATPFDERRSRRCRRAKRYGRLADRLSSWRAFLKASRTTLSIAVRVTRKRRPSSSGSWLSHPRRPAKAMRHGRRTRQNVGVPLHSVRLVLAKITARWPVATYAPMFLSSSAERLTPNWN